MALFKRRRQLYRGPQRTVVGQWERALLLKQSKLRDQIIDSSDPSGWDMDAFGVVQATAELAVARFLGPHPSGDDISRLSGDVDDLWGDYSPGRNPIGAVVHAICEEPGALVDHLDKSSQYKIFVLILGFIAWQLSLPEAAIDALILEGERIALERGWNPTLIDQQYGCA